MQSERLGGNAMPPKIHSISDASKASGGIISERRLWELIKNREIEYVKIGGRKGITPEALDRFIAKNTVPAFNSSAVLDKITD